MEEQVNYYAIIPANIRYDKDITPNAKLLYGEISALCNKEGYCWATNEYFANLYQVSKTTISLWIKSLIEKEYIISEFIYKENSKEIDKRLLILNDGGIYKNLKGYLKNLKGGIYKNLKDNNTSINNTINIYNYYQEKIDSLSPSQYEIIEEYRKYLTDELIIEAINLSADKKSFNYFKAILKDFKSKGYKCINDIQKVPKKAFKRVIEAPKWMDEDIKREEMDEKELEDLENEFKELFGGD